MIDIKTKLLLGLLLMSLLLPQVSLGDVFSNYGARDNVGTGPGKTSVNLNTPVNGRSPADRFRR